MAMSGLSVTSSLADFMPRRDNSESDQAQWAHIPGLLQFGSTANVSSQDVPAIPACSRYAPGGLTEA